MTIDWLPFAPLGAAGLHIFEEFVFPGGFTPWYRRYRGDAARITTRFLVIINGALLLACGNIAQLGRTRTGVAYWLTIAAVQASNGLWHAWASIKSHSYSPGLITGLALYVPMAVYGYVQFVRLDEASVGTALVAGLVGGSYHIWSALYHRGARVRSGG